MADAEAGSRIGIGARLRAARERSGYTSLQAAEKLHLEPSVIEALEAEDFMALVAPVYVRGHLRRYATLVGESAGELLLLYDGHAVVTDQPDLTRIASAERSSAPPQLAKPVLVVIIALAVLGGLTLVVRGLPPAGQPGNVAEATSTPDAREAARSTRAAPANTSATIASAGDAQPASPANANPTVSPATADATAPAAATGPVVRLRLRVSEDCWIEVADAAGEPLFQQMGPAGRVIDLTGQAPLRVLLGRAAGVAVEVDGQPRAIPAAAMRGNLARFTVDASGRLERAR